VWRCCHAVDSPPSKVVPLDCPRQNNWSPRTKYRSHTWSPPLAVDGPPCCHANCGLFAIAFAIALAHGEQPGYCLFDQNKLQLKSLQEGEMTPLPSKKNQRNGCRVKTWNMMQVHCICRMLNNMGTSIMRDWPSIRIQSMLPRFIVDCL